MIQPGDSRANIVMIDDDELTLESARRKLRKSDCTLLPLSDGEHLAGVLATNPVSLLIIDYRLALGTGIELMQRLRQQQIRLPATVILATASRPGQDVMSDAHTLGMKVMLKDELINTATLEALAGPRADTPPVA